MFLLTGTVVGYDDFLPARTNTAFHQFHVVVEEDSTGERVRLRGAGLVGAVPMLLSDFGEDADLNDVRYLLRLDARITFRYYNVPEGQTRDPEYHRMDIVVYRIAEITPARHRTLLFRPRAELELVHSV